MRSLRSRLTAGLLIGTSLLLAAGGLLLNHVISSRLRRDYDATLVARARSLASLTEQKSGRVWLQFTDEVMPRLGRRMAERGGSPPATRTWHLYGMGESHIDHRLAASRTMPANPLLASTNSVPLSGGSRTVRANAVDKS